MASRLNPYLSFTDNARQAMEFYHGVFGGDLVLNTFGEFGDPGGPFAELIMHAMLTTPQGFTLMAADTPPEMPYASGTSITVSLSGDDDAELRGFWSKLSEEGSISFPLEKQMWGDVFGQCVDRFGVGWMVNITTKPGLSE
ncbi:VOC family protein [Rhodococcus kronopolitis]|uniref:VOC family protein n=1 Tax=Rhodococcus kronopolitis TaxID=1460226 RepID=A0ABV9FTP4_9NOCA